MSFTLSLPRRRLTAAVVCVVLMATIPSVSGCSDSDKAAKASGTPDVSAQAAAGPGQCSAGYVAITFDDGPTPMTSAYLRALADNGQTRATFFLTGANAEQDPDSVRKVAEAGHAIGNHSYSHPFLDEAGEPEAFDELLGTNQIIESAVGVSPSLFRPPFGRTNAQIRADATELGMTEVLWTTDSFDYDNVTTDEIVRNALTVRPGGIILLHEGYQTTLDALPAIVKGLTDRGLCPGKVTPSDTAVETWPGQTHNATARAW